MASGTHGSPSNVPDHSTRPAVNTVWCGLDVKGSRWPAKFGDVEVLDVYRRRYQGCRDSECGDYKKPSASYCYVISSPHFDRLSNISTFWVIKTKTLQVSDANLAFQPHQYPSTCTIKVSTFLQTLTPKSRQQTAYNNPSSCLEPNQSSLARPESYVYPGDIGFCLN